MILHSLAFELYCPDENTPVDQSQVAKNVDFDNPELDFDTNDFLIATACSYHVCHDASTFTNLVKDESSRKYLRSSVFGTLYEVKGVGDIRLTLETGRDVVLTDVLYVPDLVYNIISVGRATRNGSGFSFIGDNVIESTTNEVIATSGQGTHFWSLNLLKDH